MRVLDTAEAIFTRKGFAAATLRDVSSALGLSHASLYYHFPGGKEDIFAAVMERNILRHGVGLDEAMGKASEDGLRAKLHGAAGWFLSQPPMDLIRLSESDMPALSKDVSGRLMALLYEHTILRIQRAIEGARESGEIGQDSDPGLIAGGFIGLVQSLHSVPVFALRKTRVQMAEELIDIILKGIGYTFRRKE